MNTLNTWLSWDLGEFADPILTGKARDLYARDLTKEYLSALSQAEEAALREYRVPIYETLIAMAEQNDADSIRRLLAICPWLDPQGYYDGLTALGAAAKAGALTAMDALWALGAGTGLNVGHMDALEFCWQCDIPEEAVRRIFRHGAPVDANDAVTLLRNEEYDLLRLVLEEAKPEKIGNGGGVASLMDYIRDYIAQEEPDDAETALLEQGMELLKEFL